jgi:tubulin polyglutamylase TTLL1
VKPAGKSQGKGISIITKLNQVKALSNQLFSNRSDPLGKENWVVSRYIDNPMLVGGKKFDLRLYCLVTNYRPLKVWK